MQSDKKFTQIWEWLTKPHASLIERNSQRQARLATTIILVNLVLFTSMLLFIPPDSLVITSSLILLLSYLLSRTPFYNYAILLAMLGVSFLVFTSLPLVENENSYHAVAILHWLTVPILLANIVLSPRYMLLLSIILLGVLTVLRSSVLAYMTAGSFGVLNGFIITICATVFFSNMIQNRYLIRPQLEDLRTTQAELQKRNQELETANKAIMELNQSLEQRVAERTEELQIAMEKAQETTRLKSEFLATMSHELRTPLNAIEGYTSVMLSKMGDAEYNAPTEKFLHRISENSQRLIAIINDFLDLSRIEAGRWELQQEPIYPEELAHHWKMQLEVLATKKGLAFEVMVDPQLPEILYGDEAALSKIGVNLLGNAVKFTSEGQVCLQMKAHHDHWQIIVADTGIGIPAEAQAFIFEEFRQTDQTTRRQYGGTGLGLAIVQKLTLNMNGKISVTSQVGEGSTFTITLPLITHPSQKPEEINT